MAKKIDASKSGPNDWLIEEMYRQWLDDPESVGEDWREFLADYKPRTAPVQATGVGAPVGPFANRDTASEGSFSEPGTPSEASATRKAPEPPTNEPSPSRLLERPSDAALSAREEPSAAPQALRGADAVIAQRMTESLTVPTATSVRAVPARLLEVNRNILNRYLARSRRGKVSYTHIIGYAVVKALKKHPGMNVTFSTMDEKPASTRNRHVNLGLAVDMRRKDGTRTLIVPNIKAADSLGFAEFFAAYEEMIRKVNTNKLTPDDFADTTVTITNPGTVGTVQSVPRLMAGQAAIIGVGAIGYPAEYQGADPEALAQMGVSKVVTLTSTYDHRVIQGAESGEFLGEVHRRLLGEEAFYDEIFSAMHVPYVPARWHQDYNPAQDSLESVQKYGRVRQLINMYRVRGHLIADLDPLEAKPPQLHPELDPVTFGLSIWDLDRTFPTGGLAGKQEMTLGEMLGVLRDAYCRTASVEYMHISEPDQKEWIQERMEGDQPSPTSEDQRQILHKLNEAEAFESFLQQKYVGHKRFSLEGAESLIPMLDAILDRAADSGIVEVVIGMAHRGRLNVLCNVIGKSYTQIFREFEGSIDPETAQGSGDVKYHLGAVGKHTSPAGNEMRLELASNPSHLEAVDPVVEGMVRAKQDILGRGAEVPVLPVLIHGDAAFAGQGVVAETLNLSQLQGYRTGGTVHIVVNNQVGFTTGADYGRSSTYATDVAKMVMAPIFHVNGDDPEACVRVARLAYEFRKRFLKDVVIDMWCYRRWGHNEADEPSFTQPLMYARIKDRRSVRKLYTETLLNQGDLSVDEGGEVLGEYRLRLQQAFDEVGQDSSPPVLRDRAEPPAPPRVETRVDRSTLDEILEAITTVPAGFGLHPKLERWMKERAKSLENDSIDWALAEALAFGTLILEGRTVRLSGQDSRRGTFSQRHLTFVDQTTGAEITPIAHLADGQAKFFAFDSLLSEFAVLAFEYGYSVSNPDALVMWEAQFGDFANGAQVVVDQFVAAAEDKWGQSSGLVLLLPHGYEGQGPDHSSSRLERFLQLGASYNIEVAVPSTPAQYFHLLRRQVLREGRKPLVVLTPKSLLRLPAARSGTADMTSGEFSPVVGEDGVQLAPKRLILCSGKFYYDLLAKRSGSEAALVRVEMPYPFPADAIRLEIERHPGAEVVWAQEEPENMGAARFMEMSLRRKLGVDVKVVSRPESPSPATGSNAIHQAEQAELIARALRAG